MIYTLKLLYLPFPLSVLYEMNAAITTQSTQLLLEALCNGPVTVGTRLIVARSREAEGLADTVIEGDVAVNVPLAHAPRGASENSPTMLLQARIEVC